MAQEPRKPAASSPQPEKAADTKAKKGRKDKKEKKSKMRKKHPVLYTFFLFFYCCFVAGMLTVIIVGGSLLKEFDATVNGETLVDLDNYKSSQSQTSIIYGYDSNGKVKELRRLHGEENRIWIDYDEIPDNLKWAFICLEDKRFYEHSGVDWIRTIGVFINPAYEGQGASTITQQLIKNLTDHNENTYYRKFYEILRALNFEKNFSKKDILEAYLNTASLGAGCYGVKTAAETYFGKTLDELTISECATIAGITKAPYSLNPYADYDACMERRDDCLFYMHDQGKITDKQYKKALKEKIKVKDYTAEEEEDTTEEEVEIISWYEEYVIDEVIEDLQKQYGYEYNEAWRKVYYGGLKIYAAVDIEVQETVEYIYENRVDFPHVGYDQNGDEAQSAITIMDYQGRIAAIVGGCDEKTTNRAFNRATDQMAKRQPGSSIKPLSVYGPAFDLGIISSGKSVVLDKAITVDGQPWPQNYEGDHGSEDYVTVYEAVGKSLNTVPARMIQEMLQLDTCYSYVNNKFHLNLTPADMTLSGMACGGTHTGVTTLEMAAAYAVFGNGGRYFEPYSYYKVTDRNGNVILDNSGIVPEQAISENAAANMLDVLKNVTTAAYGTGYGAQVPGFETFSKSGTTSDNFDKWFCAGTPHYVTAIWFGFDYNADTSFARGKTIFSTVFDAIHENLESKYFYEVKEETDLYIEQLNSQQG